jgi:hypothetical protein
MASIKITAVNWRFIQQSLAGMTNRRKPPVRTVTLCPKAAGSSHNGLIQRCQFSKRLLLSPAGKDRKRPCVPPASRDEGRVRCLQPSWLSYLARRLGGPPQTATDSRSNAFSFFRCFSSRGHGPRSSSCGIDLGLPLISVPKVLAGFLGNFRSHYCSDPATPSRPLPTETSSHHTLCARKKSMPR